MTPPSPSAARGTSRRRHAESRGKELMADRRQHGTRRGRGDRRGPHIARRRARVHQHQGVPDRAGPPGSRHGQPRLGEPVRRPPAGPIPKTRSGPGSRPPSRPDGRRRAAPRRDADAHRRSRILGDDARLPGVRCERHLARPVPHLAQHQYGTRGSRADQGARLQLSAQVVGLARLSGDHRRRAARRRARFHHDARRLRALAPHRPQGDRRRRCVGHVPDRSGHARLRRADARAIRRDDRRPPAGPRRRRALPQGARRRRGRRNAHRRGRRAA